MEENTKITIAHVTVEEKKDGKYRLTADEGWMIQNKRLKIKHKSVTTSTPDKFEAVKE